MYGVSLLDDIHNYFPALLYDVDGFHNIHDVLSYVRDETSRRFSVFDDARRDYRLSRLSTILHSASASATASATATATAAQNRLDHNVNRYRTFQQSANQITAADIIIPLESSEAGTDYASLLNLLDTLAPRITPLPAFVNINPGAISATTATLATRRPLNNNSVHRTIESLYEDVIVHADEDLINRASNQTTLDADLDTNCSVCQDRMKQGEIIRTLTHCTHQFHTACIDPWLLNQSTFCPSCRHDIREGLSRELPERDADEGREQDELDSSELMNLLFGRHF